MMKKMNLSTLLLLSTSLVSLSRVALAQDVQDFTNLKNALTEGKEDIVVVTGSDIKFSGTIGIKDEKQEKRAITIEGQTGSEILDGQKGEGQGNLSEGIVVYDKNTTLTLKNINVKNFNKETNTPYTGAIYSNGNVVIEADKDKTVEFSNNRPSQAPSKGGDVALGAGANLTIQGEGKVILGSGISSGSPDASVTHKEGTLVFGSDSMPANFSLYYGTFKNESGDVEVRNVANFFMKDTTFTGGTLKWLTNTALSGKLILQSGSALEVGETGGGSNDKKTGSLTLRAGDDLNQDVGITINDKSTLTLQNRNGQTLNKQVKGDGTLDLQNTKLTLSGSSEGGLGENLKLKASGSTLTLKDLTETAGNTLKALANSLKESGALNALHLVMQGYNSGTGDSTLTVDGEKIADLLLETGTNTLQNVTVENSGKMTNRGNSTFGQIENKENGKVENVGNFTATGVTNSGTITHSVNTFDGGVFTNNKDATFTATGNGAKLKAKTLTNNGTIDLGNNVADVGTFTNGDSDQYKDATIKGQNLTVDVWHGNHGTIDLSGDLTVSDSDSKSASNEVTNDGTITAQNLTVHKAKIENKKDRKIEVKDKAHTAEIDNQGTFTIGGELEANGNVTNGENASLTFAGGSLSGDVANSGTISTTGGTTSVSGAVENNKDWTNSGTLTFAGAVSGNGKFDNSGDLTLTGDASGFKGDFTQTAGTTTVNNGGKMFGGKNTINGGSLDVTQDKLDYGVTLGSNATWKHNSTTEALETIDNNNLTFSGSNSQATFTGSGGFTLSDQVKVNNNKVVFENTKVSLDGTDFNNVGFKDSSLNLHDDNLETKAYTFTDSFMEGTNKLHFDVQLQAPTNDEYKFTSDTVKFKNKSSGLQTLNWTLGNIYIGGEEVQATGKIYEGSSVLQSEGAVQLSFVAGKTLVSTNEFEYEVSTSTKDAGKVTIKQLGVAGDDPLATMNKHDGNRQYGVRSNFTDGAYHSQKSLDSMKNGDFSVFGENNNREKDILSGKLVDDKHEELTKQRGSFFDLEEGNVSLHVKDLTIQDAERTDVTKGGGSVLRNNNANARVDMSNLIIQNNSSSGENVKGGAIYNNGGTKNSEHFTSGLYLTSSTLTNNDAGTNGKGGAIYNDQNGYMILDSVTVDAWKPKSGVMLAAETSLPEGKNDVYNEGDIVTLGQNTFNSLVTNAGTGTATFAGDDTFAELHNTGTATATFSGKGKVDVLKNTSKLTNTSVLELQNAENTGTVDNTGALTLSGSFSGSGGSLSNEGDLSLTGDASKFTGDFTQTTGVTEVTGTFFGGASKVEGGTLTWNTDKDRAEDSTLSVKGNQAVLQVAEGNKSLKLRKGDEVDSQVYLTDGSALTVGADSSVTFENGSKWGGQLVVNGGSFTLNDGDADSLYYKGYSLDAQSGTVHIADGTLLLGEGSTIGGDVTTIIDAKTTLQVNEGASVSLNEGDTTNGTAILNGGTLSYGQGVKIGESENAQLQALSGNLTVEKNAELTLSSDKSFVAGDVDLTLNGTVNLTGGELQIDEEDNWTGTIKLSDGGTLDYHAQNMTGKLVAKTGALNLMSGSVMTLYQGSQVDDAVDLNIKEGSTLNVEGAELTLSQADQWHGTINNEGGDVTFSGFKDIGGAFNQTSADSSVTFEKSQILLDSNQINISDGNMELDESYLKFLNGSAMTLNKLSMSNGSTLDFKNGVAQKLSASESSFDDSTNNFALDVDLSGGQSDQVELGTVTGSGKVNLSDVGLVGGVSHEKTVDLQLFTGENLDGLTFTSDVSSLESALGTYDFSAIGEGWYRAHLTSYNAKAYRGQVAAVSMLQNQLGMDDMVLHHLILDHAGTVPNASNVAKTRRVNQAVSDGRGANVWVKPYYDSGEISLSEGLDVDNDVYGLIAGADMPMGTFNNGWQYVPTFYVAYQNGEQSYDDVDLTQNTGQLGFMTTFMKDNFVGAVKAYGGVYKNEMDLQGTSDDTDGWFAGVSGRAAYNVKLDQNFTLQPALFASYNMFSKQDWDSDFGHLAMETDALNGYNVAPELNLIYTQNDWSVYGTLQYMFTFDQDVQGSVDGEDLPEIGMDGDYFQYGVGVAKIWNKALSTNLQFVGRSGSRSDVGVRLGVQYMFN